MIERQNGLQVKDFVAGVAIGATFALLTAPKAGKEIRQDLSKRYENVKEKGSKIYGNIKHSTRDVMTRLNETTEFIEEEKHDLKDKRSNPQGPKEVHNENLPANPDYRS